MSVLSEYLIPELTGIVSDYLVGDKESMTRKYLNVVKELQSITGEKMPALDSWTYSLPIQLLHDGRIMKIILMAIKSKKKISQELESQNTFTLHKRKGGVKLILNDSFQEASSSPLLSQDFITLRNKRYRYHFKDGWSMGE